MDDLQLKKDVLQALISIKENGADDLGAGICDNVVEYIEESGVDLEDDYRKVYLVIESLSPQWSKFSGDKSYPVPAIGEGISPCGEFHGSFNMWTGEYGALRMELLDFLIEQLTLEVGEHNGQ